MKLDWPYEEVKEVVEAVGAKLKKGEIVGPSKDNDENAVAEAIDLISTKWMASPEKTMATWEWARRQYFKQLLIDRRRLGYFRDHERCDPQPN
ncbi:MAG: hypothetical protein WCD43_05670 [Candidatus Acidiferrales bacterium]